MIIDIKRNFRSDEDPAQCGTCRLGEFKCVTTGTCIPEILRCNGSPDCSDSSDERQCQYAEGLNLRTYPSSQNITEGRVVVFQCRDEGPLRAKVAWRRGNGLPLPPGTTDVGGRLEMPGVKLSDTGTFICYTTEFPSSEPGTEVSVYLLVEQSKSKQFIIFLTHHNIWQQYCNVHLTSFWIYLFYVFNMFRVSSLISN